MTTEKDIASVAEQLAELTSTVVAMAKDLKAMTERANSSAWSAITLIEYGWKTTPRVGW